MAKKKETVDEAVQEKKETVAFYQEPVILNSKTHQDVKVAPVDNYIFANKLNSCLALGQEFLEAAKYYPVIFSKTGDTIVPIIFLGISDNLFVDKDGTWEKDHYIPAYIRRYPFIIAEGFTQDGSLTVCVDKKYKGFGGPEGETMFNDKGEQTDFMKKVVAFLQTYHQQYQVTKIFMDYVKDLDIFKEVGANITLKSKQQFHIPGLLMVDEAKLRELPDDKIVSLVKRGYLAWIYAHLYSLTNFGKILNKA